MYATRSKLLFRRILNVLYMSRAGAVMQHNCYVNGEFVEAASGERFDVCNPITGDEVLTVPDMNADDVQNAIVAANDALSTGVWSMFYPKERAILIKRWHHAIANHAEELATIMVAETGRPMYQCHWEIEQGLRFVEWYSEEARRIYNDAVPSPLVDREIYAMKVPLGVISIITPFNYPMALLAGKAAAALAAGCTVIAKPARETPLTALALAKLSARAGIPKGVFNVVTTTKPIEIGKLFCSHPDVNGISFNGSTRVGKWLYRHSAKRVKRIFLEMEGNVPFIVFESAGLKSAIDGAMITKFRNWGQTRISANKFYIHETLYDQFLEEMCDRVKELHVTTDENMQIGPLISMKHFNRVHQFVEDACENNGKVLIGGEGLPKLGPTFYAPTIITEIDENAQMNTKQVFGPVASIKKFSDEEQVISAANNSHRGLAAYFYSKNIDQIFRVAQALEVGMIGINSSKVSTHEVPHAGFKEAAFGCSGGRFGAKRFIEYKYVYVGSIFKPIKKLEEMYSLGMNVEGIENL